MEATRESVGAAQPAETRGMLRRVVLMTAAIEAIGLLFLFTALAVNRTPGESIATVLWSSVFHTVSAFCNAGFGLHADSLERYRAAWSVNIVIMVLIMVGGIGFPVLRDLSRIVRAKFRGEDAPRLTLHSKVVLITTGLLLTVGALGFMVTEWNGKGLAGMPVHAKVISAMFQSTTARTAGFSTVSIGALAPATLFMAVVLMFIGASPCSTGGGIKTSTVGVIGVLAISKLRGREEPCAFGRSIRREAVTRALTVALLAGIVVVAFVWFVMVAEAGRFGFGQIVFEAMSAFGTVGLSTGITPELGTVSRLLLVALMYIGRLGPLTVVVSVARREQPDLVQYPSEPVMIG
jgi:trk system potassium uptake protein TrkH